MRRSYLKEIILRAILLITVLNSFACDATRVVGPY